MIIMQMASICGTYLPRGKKQAPKKGVWGN